MTEYRIYGGDRDDSLFALVDQEDYHYALKWRWSPKWSRGHTKVYLRRVFQVTCSKTRTRTQYTVFLHRMICWRAHGEPPTPEHTQVDHRNGDELDCRRTNLRWATPSMNARNINQNSRRMARLLGL